MYTDFAQWTRIRQRLLVEGISQKQIERETGITRRVLRKMIKYPFPPGIRREKSITGCARWPCLRLIDGLLKEDQGKPKKQQHNARQIWEWLKEDPAFSGGREMVRSYVKSARSRLYGASSGDHSQLAFAPYPVKPEEPAALIYGFIQAVPKRVAIRLLRAMLCSGPQVDLERLKLLLKPFAIKDVNEEMRLRASQSAFDWMRRVLQGEISPSALGKELGGLLNPKALVAVIEERRLSDRNRALAVLARAKGIDINLVSAFLHIARRTAIKFWQHYQEGGIELLMARRAWKEIKSAKDSNKQALFTLLHTPPSSYGINRTTWTTADLHKVLRRQGVSICTDGISTIIKNAGYRWRHARVVLTSKDPEYRTKVDAIKRILSNLGQDEAFFSIDEYGPFAVKRRRGVKRVAPGEDYVIPQRQKSRGWMILTAALELSRNQVTHFYSRAKNSDEMIKMADTLRAQYRTCRTIYLSWDAVSWHISKKLLAHLEQLNRDAERDAYPIVKTATLPAGAQFLNVIESVFSGMARAIIHNSDYPSVEAAKDAINLYFSQRNTHFSEHPKRAGRKIWGKELVPGEFLEGQNCKNPLFG